MLNIIKISLAIDEAAVIFYEHLAHAASDELHEQLFEDMATRKSEHVDFWERIIELVDEGAVPNLFENPGRIEQGLNELLTRNQELDKLIEGVEDSWDLIYLALRLVLNLVNPTFEVLITYFESGLDLDETGERDIEHFTDRLANLEGASPVVELLCSMLTRLWRENRELQRLSSRDHLTGLLNRRGFFHTITPLAHLAQRQEHPVCLLIVDLDDFKKLNEEHGSTVCDELLKSVANLLIRSIRRTDVVARFGGDEFIVFLTAIDLESAADVANTFHQRLRDLYDGPIPITMCMGGACGRLSKQVMRDLNMMLTKADEGLSRAQRSGSDSTVVTSLALE